jgi:hypothetical protein
LAVPADARTTTAYKGVAGPVSCTQLANLGASWWYQWDNVNSGIKQIAHVSWHPVKPWTTPDRLRTVAKKHAYWFLGNEWTLAGYSWQEQAVKIHGFCDVILSENPTAQIYASGEVIWCPQQEDAGARSVTEVANKHKQLYGSLPPLKGIHFHAYNFWPKWDMLNGVYQFCKTARQVYGNSALLWITETGDLRQDGNWREAMLTLRQVLRYCPLHGYAWFVSYDSVYPQCNLLDASGNLSLIGQGYAGL